VRGGCERGERLRLRARGRERPRRIAEGECGLREVHEEDADDGRLCRGSARPARGAGGGRARRTEKAQAKSDTSRRSATVRNARAGDGVGSSVVAVQSPTSASALFFSRTAASDRCGRTQSADGGADILVGVYTGEGRLGAR
jgi:hypothetical protein